MAKPRISLLTISSPSQLAATHARQAGQAAGAAFATDPLFLWQRPHDTPDYWKRLCLGFEEYVVETAAGTKGDKACILALTEAGGDDDKTEEVVGYAIWDSVGVELGFNTGQPEPLPPGEEASPSTGSSDSDPAYDRIRQSNFRQTWTVAENAINRVLANGTPEIIDFRTIDSQPQQQAPIFPHIKLSFLCVSPKYQGKGVGSALLEAGTRRGDELGVPIVLGASPEGEKLYRRRGFVHLGVALIYASEEDAAKWPGLNDKLWVRWPSKQI